MKALEMPSCTGVGHELCYLRAALSCTCCGKMTHKGHAYVYDNTLSKHPSTCSDDLVWVLCSAIITKKRFVPENFLPLHVSYEREVCA